MTHLAGRHPVRFGLKLNQQDVSIEDMRRVWNLADEAGFDHLWIFDHLASGGADGRGLSVFEAWTTLAAMAQATNRIRIGCMVTSNTFRHPVVLAKMAVTVDHLSSGRLEFGIGAGWVQAEHQMYGIPGLENRIGRLSESLQIITSLWTEPTTTFKGRYYALEDAVAVPKPVQAPRPPVWIGGSGEHTMELVLRHADVWNSPSGTSMTRKPGSRTRTDAELQEWLDEACLAAGRDPADIRRSTIYEWDGKDARDLVESAGREIDAGFTEHIIRLPSFQAERAANDLATILPDLRKLDPSGS